MADKEKAGIDEKVKKKKRIKSFGSTDPKCCVCDKTAYKLERIQIEDMCMHKSCFKCSSCHRQLSISNYAAINHALYCKTHYVQMFKDSGGSYAAFGDSGFKQKSSRTTAAAEAMAGDHPAAAPRAKPAPAADAKPAKKAPPAAPSAALKAKGTPKQKAAATPPKRKASRLPSHFGGNNAPPATPEDAAKTKTALTPYAQKLLRPHTPEPADGANAGGGGGDKVAALEGTVRKLRAEVSKLKAALAEASRAARAVADQLDGAL